MAKITSVEIKNDRTAEVLEAMKSQVILGLKSIGQEAEGFAKDECPVDTGTLRNSITNQVDETEKAVYVGTNVEYAPYVELNEKANHDPPKYGGGKAHFLRDSITNHVDYYSSMMEAALKAGE